MMVVDPTTGQRAKFDTKNMIIENYKTKDIISKGQIININDNKINVINKFY